MKTLRVELGDRSYPIYIGHSLLSNKELFVPHIHGRQVMVVTNETVAPLYLTQTLASLADFHCDHIVLPDGEEHKNLGVLNSIFDALLTHKHNRTTTLIALGGGVVGDITGFAAACYQRGVSFIQIPTTLLAQVDSSVGGKTGVNHALGKNMIGAFHQPKAVIADTATLNTLEDRQLSAGIAEVIKYGLIRDPHFFDWLEVNMATLLNRDPNTLSYAIERSCQNKAEVVAADELEGGQRALLNLGHTFGHAIETGMGYGEWLHGEGVSTGTCMAADLSLRLGWLTPKESGRIEALFKQANLPTTAPQEMTQNQFLELMAVDKKVIDGALRLVLLKAIGEATVTADFPHTMLIETLDHFLGH